jgi:hypothetical protein
VEDEERKRLLVRVWMDLPGAAALLDEPIQRYGTIRHGNLGYTAAEVRAGVTDQMGRRPDGASLRPSTTDGAAALG